MASGGEIVSSYYSNNSAIKFAWQIQSQNIANNTSTIYFQLRGVRTVSGYVQAGNFAITIDGNPLWSSSTRINMYNDTLITEGTFTLTHNTDGSRNFTVYIEAGIYTIAVNVSGSQTFALTGIPRQATIKSFSVSVQSETSVKYNFTTDSTLDWAWYSTNGGSSWNNLPANNIITGLSAGTTYNFKLKVRRADSQLTTDSGTVQKTTYKYPYITKVGTTNLTIGNSQTLTLYNPLSRNVTIRMYKGSTSGTQLYSGTTSGTSITFTPSASTLYASIPNSTSAGAAYALIYSGTRTPSGTFTYKVDSSINNPTFSNFTYEDTNSTAIGITGNNQTLIKGISTLAVTISSANKMVAKNSATAKNYTFVIDNKNVSADYSSSSITKDLGTIANSGTKRLTVTAYDSRNLSTAVYKDVTIYDYSKPVVNFSATRQNNFENDTTLQISGTYSRLTINNTDKNAIQQVQYRYREKNGTWGNYITTTMTAANGVFSCQDIILDLDNTKEFEIEVRATDLLSTTTVSTIVGSGQAILFISSNEKKVYYNDNELATLAETGLLANLLTTDKTNLVNAVNEVRELAINEYGINSNGHYIKFSNGVALCWQRKNINVVATQTSGSLYQGTVALGDTPITFTNANYRIWCQMVDMMTLSAYVSDRTATNFGTWHFLRSTSTPSSGYGGYVDILAIGFWR